MVTTNYDDALERSFDEIGEPYDLLVYEIDEKTGQGHFIHHPPGGEEPRPVQVPNQYRGVSLARRTAILKMHGAVDRADAERDTYVIAEDDYIHYLSGPDLSGLVPVTLAKKLRRSDFLFLGYSLRDWNMRVILHRIWGDRIRKRKYKSWAVQLNPEEIDQILWDDRGVDILDIPLEEFVAELERGLDALAGTSRR